MGYYSEILTPVSLHAFMWFVIFRLIKLCYKAFYSDAYMSSCLSVVKRNQTQLLQT